MKTFSTTSMISIGDELLDGRTADTNAQFVGAQLGERGLALQSTTVVRDVVDDIVERLHSSTTEVTIVSGGLGPTVDDLTRNAAATWAGVELLEDPGARLALEKRFADRGRSFTENNAVQAMFPIGATILKNENGTAPGFEVTAHGKTAVFFPGVPREFRQMFQTHIVGQLSDTGEHIRRLQFLGAGESFLADKMPMMSDAKISYRTRFPFVEIKIASPTESGLDSASAALLDAVGHWYVCEGASTIQARVGELLVAKKSTMTTVESCTGGGISAAITDIPGSSQWFNRAFITYANDAKADLVGVLPSTLERWGAVSAQTVCQMAAGGRKKANAEYTVAVSGVAGPGGGSEDKPVGTVYFGLASPRGTFFTRRTFPNDGRIRIRQRTIACALQMLVWELTGTLAAHTDNSGPFLDDAVFAAMGVSL